MKLTEYKIENEKFNKSYTFALVSDLHASPVEAVIEALRRVSPDIILAAGDICECFDGTRDGENEVGFRLLEEASRIAPTFYCFGNHELGGTRSWLPRRKHEKKELVITEENQKRLDSLRVTRLADEWVSFDGVKIGGLVSGTTNEGGEPHVSWLGEFCRLAEPKVLICHHPEYYK